MCLNYYDYFIGFFFFYFFLFFFLMCLYFIVNFIQFWYEVYDQDYVHTNRHREMGTHSNLS